MDIITGKLQELQEIWKSTITIRALFYLCIESPIEFKGLKTLKFSELHVNNCRVRKVAVPKLLG